MIKVKALTWATTILAAAAAFIVLHHFDPLEIVSVIVGTLAAGYATYQMVTNDLAAARIATRVDVIERIIIEHGQWRLEHKPE